MTPAGMLMGIPLPAGVRLLAATEPQLVAWAWGMNGALSVARRDPGHLHRDELGLLRHAALRRRGLRGGGGAHGPARAPV